jgi:hypothetical protein
MRTKSNDHCTSMEEVICFGTEAQKLASTRSAWIMLYFACSYGVCQSGVCFHLSFEIGR